MLRKSSTRIEAFLAANHCNALRVNWTASRRGQRVSVFEGPEARPASLSSLAKRGSCWSGDHLNDTSIERTRRCICFYHSIYQTTLGVLASKWILFLRFTLEETGAVFEDCEVPMATAILFHLAIGTRQSRSRHSGAERRRDDH